MGDQVASERSAGCDLLWLLLRYVNLSIRCQHMGWNVSGHYAAFGHGSSTAVFPWQIKLRLSMLLFLCTTCRLILIKGG